MGAMRCLPSLAARSTRPCLLPAALVLALAALVVAPGCSDEETSSPTPTSTGGSGADGGGASGGSGADGGTGGGAGGGGGEAPPVVKLPRASIQPEELAVLVNASDPQSVAVSNYYVEQRQIPPANVVTVDFPPGNDVMSEADFGPIKATVDAAVGDDIQAFAITWTTPYRVDCMSITSAFALGFDTMYCATPCNPTAAVDYFDSESVAPYTDHGIRPAMSIVAAQQADAIALIDRGIAADGTRPTGDGYFVRTTDTARSVRWQNFMATVDDWDYPEGLTLTYVDNSDGSGSNVVSNTDDILFYFTGLVTVADIDTNTYRPGAVADHLTSFGGRVPTSGQMSIARWLEAGVTASYGTVVEPCNFTQKFPNTRVMLPHYFRGQTVLEAYWKSVHWPGEGLFAGEPLARPWGGADIEWNGSTLTIRTTQLDPSKIYELASADQEPGPYTTVVLDNITIPHHQLATITLDDATAPFYELRESN